MAMKPVLPCYVKFGKSLVSPTYDVIDLVPHFILMLSSLDCHRVTLHIMPSFCPNEHMYNTWKHKV